MHTEPEAHKSPIAQKEEEILAFWKERGIFEKSLAKDAPKGEFVFYEGPPTANGRPGIHHLEARAFKDIIPRFKTMRGYHVRRKAGWDTHGLPVELEVEKKLALRSKKEIEQYGIAAFNEECKKSVWTYVDEWRRFTERTAYWVDIDDAYVTYDPRYMESLFNVVKQVHERGLLYKDYKVVPWCVRCGTALSSHELAQGYQEVADTTLFVKFKVSQQPSVNSHQQKADGQTFLLAWTTTPWTLPGNVALAVGKDIAYVKARVGNEIYILARERLSVLGDGAEILEEMRGADLLGLAYEPLFPFQETLVSEKEQEKQERAFCVYAGEFVTTEEGTGIVHIAPMYGQDDFELGTREGLPKVHTVGEDGHFLEGTGALAGLPVKEKDAFSEGEKHILRMLDETGALFKKEKHTHTYPFCWRCKTPLIYFAHDSWYIAMSKLRDTLVAENATIHWEPEHIREGRFGEWLSGIKDWAISRDRFWGTPLPVWQSADGAETLVVGSLEELRAHTKKSGNTYFAVRHGESTYFAEDIFTIDPEGKYGLTEKGVADIRARAADIPRDKKIRIISSPVLRTKESAELLAEELGMARADIMFDTRLAEINFGVCEGKPRACFKEVMAQAGEAWYTARAEGGESNDDVRVRASALLFELEETYQDETIVLVTHEGVAQALVAASRACTKPDAACVKKEYAVPPASLHAIPFVPFPHNERFLLDLHRPYIDELTLLGKSGEPLLRAREVMDVWFDSGCMPFAQDHYPFENKEHIEGNGFPADYICEAIDQTRGWFYTLHAVGALMGRGKAFKNCICLGHILDSVGKKMSKSLGNIVNPWDMLEKYGADALRFWMYSVNQPGESKNFDEKTVDEIVKKVFNLLTNVVQFYTLYAGNQPPVAGNQPSRHILDLWILARLNELGKSVTEDLERYKVLEPARAIRDFIADLSQWYIRRSRDRFKSSDPLVRAEALATTRFVLRELAKIMAPFTPFLAEDMFARLRDEADPESVHLAVWPPFEETDREVLHTMSLTREVVSHALELRAAAGIKVRQPLSSLTIPRDVDVFEELILEEVNVKEIKRGNELALDTEITNALRKEGDVRELIRAVQDLRKQAGLNPSDRITLGIETDERGRAFIDGFRKPLMEIAGVENIIFAPQPEGVLLDSGLGMFRITISIHK